MITEEGIRAEIEAIISRRGIANRKAYLDYLFEQKDVKRAKAKERMKEAELEMDVIKGMMD